MNAPHSKASVTVEELSLLREENGNLLRSCGDLAAERDALREALEEIKERCADGDPLTSIWNVAQVTLNRPE